MTCWPIAADLRQAEFDINVNLNTAMDGPANDKQYAQGQRQKKGVQTPGAVHMIFLFV